MRCLSGLMCACALGLVLLVACSETGGTGGGGMGGRAGSGGMGGDAGSGGAGGVGGGLPDPVWSDIYWSVMFTECVDCHGPTNDNLDQNPNNPGGAIPGGASAEALAALDLTGEDKADTTNWPSESHSAVVNALAADSGMCAGQGTLVIPNNSADSIMIQKMRAMQTCGTQMPQTGILPEPLIQIVEAWVDMGAPNN